VARLALSALVTRAASSATVARVKFSAVVALRALSGPLARVTLALTIVLRASASALAAMRSLVAIALRAAASLLARLISAITTGHPRVLGTIETRLRTPRPEFVCFTTREAIALTATRAPIALLVEIG
jgi:hypothetical protein